ncbi:ATP-NAD kinase family protein [Streptomyces coffeae]|uniref:ATP-NAD kinase family protein n=1 Tax=Streptomyces coffeae TaxID=621382 RepID=UPI0027DD453F|nr:NAD(+)/NADH kinase [Streptomyces coffeae]
MTPPRIGLVVNPVAGLGGRVGLKGSDGRDVQARALAMGAVPQAGERAAAALAELRGRGADCELLTAGGEMGAHAAQAAGWSTRTVYTPGPDSGPEDTVAAVRALRAEGVGLVLFAGGDGTARDVLDGLGQDRVMDGRPLPALGIPTGVKMHSAVFAVTPRAAGETAAAWAGGGGQARLRLRAAEVMDRDEEALRRGELTARLYGWLTVPDLPARIQQRKSGAPAADPAATGGIAAELAALIPAGAPLILGPGSTTHAVAAALGADVALTGVNAIALRDGTATVLARDAATADLEVLIRQGPPPCIALSPIGGQGFLLGRGNQQISPALLRAAGRDRLLVLCTEAKLAALGGRPLLADTGDPVLNAALGGYLPVITGRGSTSPYRLTS